MAAGPGIKGKWGRLAIETYDKVLEEDPSDPNYDSDTPVCNAICLLTSVALACLLRPLSR